jgi:hypothetical protein
MIRMRRSWRDERGMTLIFVGMSFVALMSAAMLSVDVGTMMVARSQSQNAADAGALAGAVALVFDDFDDRTPTGPAVQSAIAAATNASNPVFNESTSVIAADVTFPALEKVRVRVERSTGRGNPLLMFIGPMFGIDSVDMGAFAVAEVTPANAATCIKPWAIPDKWTEVQTPAWDPADELLMYYENGPRRGTLLPNPDIYSGVNDTPTVDEDYTGYRPDPQGPDYGRQLTLKPGSPHQAINSSHFYPIALPGGNGGSWYEDNIPGCWPGTAEIGDMVPVEPGNMTGPTGHGTSDLIAKDPGARWVNGEVVSTFKPSPRIVVIPVFDPNVYEAGRQHGRLDIKIANFVGFFVEDVQGNDVIGRMVPMTGLVSGNGPVSPGAYLQAIRLVE